MSTISLRLSESLHAQARAARGSRAAFQRVLEKVKDRVPIAGDER
ncbi:hypothetical protein [Gemmatimonas sp.]